jgi:hypothetical protein
VARRGQSGSPPHWAGGFDPAMRFSRAGRIMSFQGQRIVTSSGFPLVARRTMTVSGRTTLAKEILLSFLVGVYIKGIRPRQGDLPISSAMSGQLRP